MQHFQKFKLKTNTYRIFVVLLCLITLVPQSVSAITEKQQNLYKQNILYYDEQICGNISGTNQVSEDSSLSGSSNSENVYQFFVGKGYKPFQAAAIIGNMAHESGVEPQRQEGLFDRIVKAEEWPAPGGGRGYGIVQWTPGSKMIDPVKASGKDPNTIDAQLNFLYEQLQTSEKTAGDDIKATTNIEDAVLAFQGNQNVGGQYYGFERPGDEAGTVPERTAAAKAALRKFEGTTVSGGTVASATENGGCTCTASGSTANQNGKTVVLDPGHSGGNVPETDPESGIKALDYDNGKETIDMWKVSEKIRTKLEIKGYKVITTKKSADDTVGLIARAVIANNAKADIAVSIHSTGGSFGNASSGWVTPQEVGLYRQSGSNIKKFENAALAQTSKEYSAKVLEERKKTEGGVQIHGLDFSRRDLPATGNISIVQLFSKVPWVYNEVGQTGINLDKYAEGISNGIISALGEPDSGTTTTTTTTASTPTTCETGSTSVAPGDLSALVKSYAWPDYHPKPYTTPKKTYKDAYEKARSEGIYIGGIDYPGIDCGGFVTLLMINSGFEPNYNYGGKISAGAGFTGNQETWLKANWTPINPVSTKDLKPGDVAINDTHTYVFVGKIDGFNSLFASASLDGRAPMAGAETDVSPGFNWYRKK